MLQENEAEMEPRQDTTSSLSEDDTSDTSDDDTKMKVVTRDQFITLVPSSTRGIQIVNKTCGISPWDRVAKKIQADKNGLKKYPVDLEELHKLLASRLDECIARFDVLRHHPGLACMIRETYDNLPHPTLKDRARVFLDALE